MGFEREKVVNVLFSFVLKKKAVTHEEQGGGTQCLAWAVQFGTGVSPKI